MHARTITFPLPADQLERALNGVRAGAQNLPGQPGFLHAYWMYDEERATMNVVVIFESAEAEAESWRQLGPATEARWREAGISPDVRRQAVVHSV
jgi:hypothetical protein